ncbi:TetR/AcrR family transcriptional regulator [Oceanicoccus sp. KOV_DT_Chl]|uniref:TetR/AcrR family transcriptional regulator n=1 Tax=Oceanicoccus sp. KOV_DT_Chl TaxID=1904639 RepID=UPI000C7BFE9D|nr:TetR/AcrR family transcriptional regulator [Oceanicoccus sp. KOV_DT_Chl]
MENPIRNRGKSEQKRQQILDAACNLFLKEGFEGVSMDAVAKSADVSKQTVYSHFGNKEELFSASVEFECDKHEINDQLFDPERPVEQVLLELATHFTDLLLSEQAIRLHRICVASTDQRSTIAELFWSAGPVKLKARLSHYLKQQVERGTLSIPNIDFAAQQLIFMLKGEYHHRRIFGLSDGKPEAELPAYLQSCVTLFLSAYAKK